MSEDNVNKNNDNADDAATLKDKEIEQLKREKAAMEMKLKRTEEDLYDEDFLNYKNEQNKKEQPQDNFMSGGRLKDYSEEEIGNLPISKLAGLIAGEVYNQLKNESQSEMTKEQIKARKKEVAATRIEIQKFAKDYPDFWNFAAKIDELSNENPNLNTEQLYVLAGGKLKEKPPSDKKEEKKKEAPDTRPGSEAGMKQSDKNLSRREIIEQEWQKTK